jgi:hypothetical protein
VSAIEPTRRDFIAGLCASLALVFAPWERFKAGLAGMLEKVYTMSARQSGFVITAIDRTAGLITFADGAMTMAATQNFEVGQYVFRAT